jgi:stringent starvation protein B
MTNNVTSLVYGTTHSKGDLIRDCRNLILGSGKIPLIMVRRAGNDSLPEELQTGKTVVIDISPSAGQELCIESDEIHFFASFKGKSRFVTIPIEDILTIYDQEDKRGLVFGGGDVLPGLPPGVEFVLIVDGQQSILEKDTLTVEEIKSIDLTGTEDFMDMLKTPARRH